MAMVNIAKDYRKYSSEELRSFAYSGLLECNGYDLDSFLEYLFQDMYSQPEIEKMIKEAVAEDRDSYSSVESLKQNIREAIEILEDSL